MRGPEIISFNNGVIEWTVENDVGFCILEINGKTVNDRLTEKVYAIDLSCDSDIRIIAVRGAERAETHIKYDKTTERLGFMPVSVQVTGEHIKWNRVSGACSYRVYDLEFNAATVFGTEYDLTDRNLALCVCPDSCGGVLDSAEPQIGEIEYLSGSGTESDPYRIYTTFDLRAIDYYETVYAFGDKKQAPNVYRIENDIDYGIVDALENESNLYTLKKPLFGTLDGNNNKLRNIRVCYNGGYWALFDYITASGRVKNIIFENAEILNRAQDFIHPINCSVALVAHVNDGEIAGIKLDPVRLVAAGGGVSGIVTHNRGKVIGCTVFCELVQAVTETSGKASYEMSGVVLENLDGGLVGGNRVKSVTVRGNGNIRSAAGIVAVNRVGGIVKANEYGSVVISGAVDHSEYGGIVAYNAGTTESAGTMPGTLTVNGERVESESGTNNRGRIVGKNDGSVR